MLNNEFILRRHPSNPILTPRDFPGSAFLYNPGQTLFNDKVLLLLAVHHNSMRYRDLDTQTTVHVATSEDGVKFDINPEPFFYRSTEGHLADVQEQCVDFRITKIDETYYVVYPGCGNWGTMAILGKTTDFKTFEKIDIISLPDNRVPCLFPEKINGMYVRLDRPYRVCPNDFHEFGNIWLSYSPDLLHWGRFRPLIKPGYTYWAGSKIGPTSPHKTDRGWLVIVHGVTRSCTGHRYCIGALLLDADNPEKLIGKTKSAILSPSEPYEFNGKVPNTVFPCGSVYQPEKDKITVYYGCADSYVGMASGSMEELVNACINEM